MNAKKQPEKKYPRGFDWSRPEQPQWPVSMITTRDDEGVAYSVVVADTTMGYGDEFGVTVWSHEVAFGQRDETLPGGEAFRYAAKEQEKVSSEWVKFIEAAS